METSSEELTIRPAKVPIEGNDRGLQLRSLDEMWRFAVAVVNSRTFKDIDTPESALIRLQAGLELGLSPIWSLVNIFVVNGKPAVWGDALLGLVLAHPDCVDVIETMDGDDSATCEVQRKGRLPVKRTFTMDDAKKAGLVGKSGPWTQYPKRMLQMRARSWACRDSFADALRGLGVVEELKDTTPKQATARVIERPTLLLPDEPEQILPVPVLANQSHSLGDGNEPSVGGEARESTRDRNDPQGDNLSMSDSRGVQKPSGERRNSKGEFEWDAE